jgi:HKD family nuclease
MRFVNEKIGKLLLEELRNAIEARIAVAFFYPDDPTLRALEGLTDLTLIVSEEFTINNPYRIERLKTATLRSIPPDDANGKLHAKVFIVKRRDGSSWVLIGSANMTHNGMFRNQEACVVMESANPSDNAAVRRVEDWFDSLLKSAHSPDLDRAKQIFDARSQYRLVERPSGEAATDTGYWALKTTSGTAGRSHWPMFLAENVIALGWEDIPVDPANVSEAQLRAALKNTYEYTDKQASVATNNIRRFVGMKTGDIVLVCRGYSSTQKTDVHIHGVARVIGPFRAESPAKHKWRFRRDAVIQVIETDLPRDIVAAALGKETLRQTVHGLDKAEFERLEEKLRDSGVHVEV